jgi:hypothetical protein
MRNFDFSSSWRSTVGFESLFDLLEESVGETDTDNHY